MKTPIKTPWPWLVWHSWLEHGPGTEGLQIRTPFPAQTGGNQWMLLCHIDASLSLLLSLPLSLEAMKKCPQVRIKKKIIPLPNILFNLSPHFPAPSIVRKRSYTIHLQSSPILHSKTIPASLYVSTSIDNFISLPSRNLHSNRRSW